jgi:hypothetical protein
MVAVAAGWEHWRSYRVSSVGHYYGEKGWLGCYVARGRVVVGIGRERMEAVVKWDYWERPVRGVKDEVSFEDWKGGQFLGVGFYQAYTPRVNYLLMPLWLVWGLAAVPVVSAIWKSVRKRWRKSVNLCEGCGYDLRGSGGKCPECGRELAVGKTAIAV